MVCQLARSRTEADYVVKKHPEADSLYVESIDIGEEEPRTVCSGLVKYMTEDEIRGATIIVIVRSASLFMLLDKLTNSAISSQ
jgi:tRNA-binding EMAP/Myf-like protein